MTAMPPMLPMPVRRPLLRRLAEKRRASVAFTLDGAPATAHGFHVLLPAVDSPTYDASLRLGEAVRDTFEAAGVQPATYVEGAMRASDDYATLNHSAKPAVIVELGNMRHDGDAAALTDPAGQAVYARALVDAVEAYAVATPAEAP